MKGKESMSSISFDTVADRYDATRRVPEEVSRQLAQEIDQAVHGNAQTQFLEVGVGTGRFAIPVASLGRQYTGIDISPKMLQRLFEKLHTAQWQQESLPWGSSSDEDTTQNLEVQRFISTEKQGMLRLAQADMTALPFHDASFDAIIAVHVFHLISEWQKALQEILRVLRPGGMLVRCWSENWQENWQPGSSLDIRKQWCTIVQDLGGKTDLPGASDQMVTEWLHAAGFQTESWLTLSFQQEWTPRILLKEIEQRLWTSTQLVPDSIFEASIERLRQWANEHYGAALDTVSTQEQRVTVYRTPV
jgi:ubiquinone/menaquinone biosynthesis C-methylase UbiE